MLCEGCGQDVGEFQAVAGRVEELGAIAHAFVEGGSFHVAVAEDRSGQVGFLEVGFCQGAVLEERALHGGSGGIGTVDVGMADVGVVQAGTSERDPSEVECCRLVSDGPAAQVGVR